MVDVRSSHGRWKRMKRSIFMASLFLSLSCNTKRCIKDYQRCNDELHLVNDIGALALPDAVSGFVWKDKDTLNKAEEAMSIGRIDKAVDMLSSVVPKWLHYTGLKKDTEEVLRHVLRVKLQK